MQGQLQGQFLGTSIGSRQFPNFAVSGNDYSSHEYLLEHSHERAFLSVLLRGSYLEYCGSTTWECNAGQAILHEPGETHANKFCGQGGRVLNIEFLPHYVSFLKANDFEPLVRRRIDSPFCWHFALQLEREIAHGDQAAELAIEGLTLQLLAELLRSSAQRARRRSGDWLSEVKETIHRHYREPLSLSRLATEAQVHPVHLARSFSKHFGCTIGDYLRRLRVTSACDELLNSTLSIAEVAMRNGFADQSHLTRAVKQSTGLPPCQFRKGGAPPSADLLSAFKC